MKPFIQLMITIFLSFFITSFAQNSEMGKDFGRMGAKIEQLEKIKIIEELNLNDETTLLFFAKRNAYRANQKKILHRRNKLYKKLNNSFDSNDNIDYKSKLDEIFEIEKEMQIQREDYFKSLDKILSPKQIIQLIVFEFNFRNEVRHQFIKLGDKKRKRTDR